VSLQIRTTRVEPDIVVVHLSGRITSGQDRGLVEPLVNDLLNQNEKKLIFDLDVLQIGYLEQRRTILFWL
jgi:hypothetical protein